MPTLERLASLIHTSVSCLALLVLGRLILSVAESRSGIISGSRVYCARASEDALCRRVSRTTTDVNVLRSVAANGECVPRKNVPSAFHILLPRTVINCARVERVT